MGKLISLADYARLHGHNPDAARQKALRGGFHTAVRIGRDWLIDEDEPYADRRLKSGRYINARKK